jgi:hypothetical protein
MTRLQIATQIFAGMCAGDWKLDVPEGETWDDVAIPRAFELADKMLRESKTALELEADKYHD